MSKLRRNDVLSKAKVRTKSVRKQAEKDLEVARSNNILGATSTPFQVKGAIDALNELENDFDDFKVPQPMDIVIPPRKSNPFTGITFEKAKEMKNKKRY